MQALMDTQPTLTDHFRLNKMLTTLQLYLNISTLLKQTFFSFSNGAEYYISVCNPSSGNDKQNFAVRHNEAETPSVFDMMSKNNI